MTKQSTRNVEFKQPFEINTVYKCIYDKRLTLWINIEKQYTVRRAFIHKCLYIAQ